jgi:hypothetical protein
MVYPRAVLRRLLAAVESLPGGPLWSGALIAGSLLLVLVVWMLVLSSPEDLWSEAGPPWPQAENRINVVIILLGTFLFVTARYDARRNREEMARLRPHLACSDAEFSSILQGFDAYDPGRLRGVRILSAVVGLVVVPATQADPLFLLDPQQWQARVVWSLGSNALLFVLIGQGMYAASYVRSGVARVVRAIEPIDLLDRSSLVPFSRMGLRNAFVWAGGSSIASLIFLDVERMWPVALVIAVTLFMATRALLDPVREIQRRLRAEKRAELARVRERIRSARESALERDDAEGVARLPGLLAWESRIEQVAEWPFDAPTLLRFGALVALAVGSWLGGALVERLLGIALD